MPFTLVDKSATQRVFQDNAGTTITVNIDHPFAGEDSFEFVWPTIGVKPLLDPVTGVAGTDGSLETGVYNVLVTATDNVTGKEIRRFKVSGDVKVTGPTGSIAVRTPDATGYTYNLYTGMTSVKDGPVNLAACAIGPKDGPLAGMASGIAPATDVTITGVGMAQVPPAIVKPGANPAALPAAPKAATFVPATPPKLPPDQPLPSILRNPGETDDQYAERVPPAQRV